MNGFFEHFPVEAICPICRGNQDIGTILVAINGTKKGNLVEGQPVHAACILQCARFNRDTGMVYIEHKPMQQPLIPGVPPVPVEGNKESDPLGVDSGAVG